MQGGITLYMYLTLGDVVLLHTKSASLAVIVYMYHLHNIHVHTKLMYMYNIIFLRMCVAVGAPSHYLDLVSEQCIHVCTILYTLHIVLLLLYWQFIVNRLV